MDRAKIGSFISTCRKDKNITQEQLAERLGVTNKSVSKWETGKCLPEASLYEPLCSILGVTINELFSGQRINDADYKRVADENLMDLLKHKLYYMGDMSIEFSEFDKALTRISELTAKLNSFHTKEDAIAFLMDQTEESYERCSNAYEFYIGLLYTSAENKEQGSCLR